MRCIRKLKEIIKIQMRTDQLWDFRGQHYFEGRSVVGAGDGQTTLDLLMFMEAFWEERVCQSTMLSLAKSRKDESEQRMITLYPSWPPNVTTVSEV